MIEKEITSDWIDRYHDGDLDEQERAVFLERMASSPLLRAEAELNARLTRFLEDQELIDLLSKINRVTQARKRRFPGFKTFLIAASFVGMAMLGGLVYLLINGGIGHMPGKTMAVCRERPDTGTPDSGRQDQAGKRTQPTGRFHARPDDRLLGQFTDQFAPLVSMEVLAGVSVRSAWLHITSPPPEISVAAGTGIPFRWEYPGGTESLSLVVMNNRGLELLSQPLTGGRYFLLGTRGFPVGLYYWKVMAGDDFVAAGKIYIRNL